MCVSVGVHKWVIVNYLYKVYKVTCIFLKYKLHKYIIPGVYIDCVLSMVSEHKVVLKSICFLPWTALKKLEIIMVTLNKVEVRGCGMTMKEINAFGERIMKIMLIRWFLYTISVLLFQINGRYYKTPNC